MILGAKKISSYLYWSFPSADDRNGVFYAVTVRVPLYNSSCQRVTSGPWGHVTPTPGSPGGASISRLPPDRWRDPIGRSDPIRGRSREPVGVGGSIWFHVRLLGDCPCTSTPCVNCTPLALRAGMAGVDCNHRIVHHEESTYLLCPCGAIRGRRLFKLCRRALHLPTRWGLHLCPGHRHTPWANLGRKGVSAKRLRAANTGPHLWMSDVGVSTHHPSFPCPKSLQKSILKSSPPPLLSYTHPPNLVNSPILPVCVCVKTWL